LPSLGGRSLHRTWPDFVEGTAKWYEPMSAMPLAANTVHRLCALLSVALNAPWCPREAPWPTAFGSRVVPEMPHYENPEYWIEPEEPWKIEVRLPEWIDRAWAILEANGQVLNALNANYEGLRLFPEHSSYALIAFVGCIEGIAAMMRDLERCETCKGQIGATERFRTALRLVRSPEDVKALTKSAYGPRSGTAHAGQLYGGETELGVFRFPSVFTGRDAATEFTWDTVYAMRAVCHDLLLRIFIKGIPEALVPDSAQ
jgi:hypothetical protein